MRWIQALLLAAVLAACGGEAESTNGGGSGPKGGGGETDVLAVYDRGLDFLTGRFDDEGWVAVQGRRDPGLTALAASAIASRPGGIRPKDRELLDRALDRIVETQKDDGGIYDEGLANYKTCAAVLALTAAKRAKDDPTIERAVTFLKGLQFDENRGVEASSEHYGGLGYGTHERPDLSNTQYNLESLRAGGVDVDDPVFKKVMAFLEKTQNRSETNPGGVVLPGGERVTPGDDGGAAYRPGESKAGVEKLADGTVVLRSYGSMTYALLKCYIYAGLKRDDPRVQAAFRWIQRNWTWDENPGFQTDEEGQQGLFYYYTVAAQALALLDVDAIEVDGEKHDWRKELSAKLAALQQDDGSWVNAQDRWWEGLPELATSYALVSLRECAGK